MKTNELTPRREILDGRRFSVNFVAWNLRQQAQQLLQHRPNAATLILYNTGDRLIVNPSYDPRTPVAFGWPVQEEHGIFSPKDILRIPDACKSILVESQDKSNRFLIKEMHWPSDPSNFTPGGLALKTCVLNLYAPDTPNDGPFLALPLEPHWIAYLCIQNDPLRQGPFRTRLSRMITGQVHIKFQHLRFASPLQMDQNGEAFLSNRRSA